MTGGGRWVAGAWLSEAGGLAGGEYGSIHNVTYDLNNVLWI
jgi:hypothetical protein